MTDHKNFIPDYDLLAKYFAGETSVAQTKEIEIWVAENPANKKTFDSMYFLWIQSAKNEFVKQVDVTSAWTKMQFRMNAAKQEPAVAPVKEISIYKKTAYRLLQLAAAIIIAIGIGVLIKYLNSDVEYISTEAQQTAINLTLPDKSEIKLNKKSKISYPEKFKGKERHIKLEGEAFFDVKPDKEKPFIIEAQHAMIKVVGTSFNVQAYDSSNVVEVIVVTGTVELSGKDKNSSKITLHKGEKGKIDKLNGIPVKDTKVDEGELSWMNNRKIFKDTELYIVAETLSTAYNTEIVILNENIKYCTLTAVYEGDLTIDEIMLLLQTTFKGLIIERTENKITIDGTACQ